MVLNSGTMLVSDVIVPGQPEDITARDALLLWSRRMVEGYPNIQIRDFSKSWRDGKALLTIIHRNRPDLVDFRRVQTQTARQNLEQAFSTAEREFGVTRLLDPEDVDVPEPDEKSVMTYVSSLYDVFPVVPSVEQTLKENERQLKVEEYKDLSAKLLSWIKEVTDMMMQRDFPTTLMEMKALLAEFSRFRIEDVPPRLDMKGKIFHLFDSIETRGAFPTGIDESLYPENIKRLWNRFELAMQERERTLQAEIIRLERLQRLAEKIHREARHAEDSLDDLGRRIGDEERRVDVIHPFEAKRNCDALDRALKNIDDTVKSLMRDIHALQDGKYPTADQLQKRVSTLQTRVSQLRTALISNVVQKLLSKSYVEEEMTTTKRREVLTEVRLVETNPAFRHVQECLHWIEAKQASLEGTDFGSDMNSVQQTLDQHLKEHQEILAFRKEVDRCITDKRNLSTEEQKLYTEWLSRVEVAFSLLTNTSSRRLKCLESLLEFVQSATQELIWLSEKEEIEVTRDWTSERLNMPVDQFYQNLIHEMENREAQFNAIQDRGNSMVLERHPAAKTIEAYMSAMQSQWSWLLQLSVCLEAHVKHTSSYYQFFEEAQQCEQWMQQQTETISNRVSRENQPIEELQQMMKELQEIQDSLADYDRRVASLSITSREIIPLKQRSQPVFSPIKIRCQCIYKQPPMILQKGEECTLVDNSQKIRWRVRNSSGQEELVPSVCLLIPPPNYEAMQFADRLKIQLDQLQGVFKTRQRRLRQNIVLATIKLIRSWDLRQFQSLDPIRREALLRVLNEDAAKLISEVGEGDREMRRLQEELAECNQKFHSLLFELSEEEMRKTRAPDKDLVKKLDSCSYQLSSLHQDLMSRVQQPLPHDRKTVILANQQQRDWERTLQQQELPVEEIKQLLQKLPKKTPQVESKLNLITQKWEQMINMGSTYAERLKVLDSIIAQVDSLRSSVADHEVYLASQDSLSSDPSTLRSLHTELRDMQTSLQQQQHTVDSVNKDVATLRSLVQQTRPGVIRHHDLEVLEKSIIDLLGHWQNVKDQVAERLKNMSDTVDNVSQYTNGLVEEQLFVATTQDKINAQNPVTDDLEEAKQLLQPAMEAYNLLGEHQHQIETVNRRGGQFIREAKHLSDSFEKLVQDLNNKVNWISDIDQLLKDDQPVGEEAYKVQTQLEAIKALQHDLSQHQQPIRSLVYQSEQLVEHQQEELTPEQVTELQQLEGTLKTSFSKVQKTCDNRVKHLTSAAEELTKFEAELKKFQTWLTSTEQELKGQEEAVKDLDNLKHMMEQHQELSDDIIAHGADVKYLSFAVQKYMEEAKLHKLEIDAYKADRQKPSRLSRTSWIAMDNKEVEVVKEKQREAESRYNNLKPQCNKLGEKLAALSNKQKNFNENAWKMLSWLTDAEGKLNSSRQELSAPEPEALRDHLETIKTLGNDAIAHKVELDELDKSAKDLIAAMRDLDIGGDHIQKLEDMVEEIASRHESVTNEINDRTTGLQAAVTKSQDVQGAIENLLSWLGDTEQVLNSQRPISLNEDNLKEQIQELNVLEADVDSHKPSVDSMKQAASELIKTCDHEMARALEAKISDINSKYMDVKKKCRARKKDVNDVLDKLEKFQEELDHCKEWLQTSTDSLQSVDWSKRPVEQLREKVDNVMQEKGKYLQALQSIQSQGNDLVQDPRTGETLAVKDSLKTMENLWNDFNMHLNERLNETNMKEKQGREYEACKHDVVQWLSTMESNVDAFEPVAVDMDVVGRQIEILQPMIEDYHNFSSKMDDVNDLGNAYDAVESGDHRPKSPIRFRGGRRIPSLLSPHNVHSQSSSFVIPSSPITNNASSPMSSDSSGISSRKSSSDNFLVDDLSETQQDLLDMNQRYELIGERLFDRQQELQGMLETIKAFLQDLSDILTWLDMKEQDLEKSATLPTSEKEAKHRLREHEISHQELLSKESMVDDIRKKAQDLMKRKRGVPGIEMVQQQLADLDDKWLGVKVTSEQRRKALEDIVADLRSYKDAGVTLQKWIAQKEKMVAVLGPVATDPAMIKNQQDQVKVLQEEQHAQEPLYDKFIESANAVLDKCTPDSKHAVHISEKISVISKGWDRLTDRLREREKSLQAVEGLSGEFNENLQQLGHWLADYATTLDSLSPIATSSEKQKQQLRELEELKAELKSKLPQLEKIKEVGKKLCDNTKDSSTKLDLRNKISNLEKPIAEAEKKLVLRENEIHKASQEVEKFHDSCKELLDWVDGIRERHSESEPVSANSDIIKQQAQKNKELLKDVSEAEPEMKSLLEKARSLARDSTNPELKSILDQLERAQSDLAEIRQQASEKDEKLEAANKHAQAFQNQLDKMGMWLDLNKDKLNSLKPDTLDKDAVYRKLRDAQALQADLMRLATDHESLNQEGVALMSTADSDKESIQAKLDGINRKWDDVKQGVANALLNLEDTSQRLTECEELKRDVEENLIRLEAELKDNREASKDPRNADKIKVLQDDVNDLNAKVDYLDALINTFSTDRGSAPPSQLIKDLGKTKERLRALQDETNHLLADMEAGSHIMEKFQDKLEESGSHLSELEQELNNLKPVARDEVALDNQKREIEEFISRLNDAENHLDDVEKQFNNLVNDGYISHSDPLKSQIDGLRLQLEKLQEQAEERKANVAETANKIEGVVDNLRRMKTSIDRAANELEMHEPIASDVTAIKRQQGELKDFVRSVIEPLQKRFEAVTEEALDLTQTARPGVDTGILEADIDNLTDKWSSLSAKVSERDHNLDNALLQSGKFNEAFESFLSWLKESEDLVSHQKPVSPDYKVAKAQLQEQKFLLKMLEDRASGVKSVKDSGKSLQKNLDPREQKGIQNQIAQLDQRWEALNSNATERLKALESIITVAQDFQEVRDPLVSWVETMEKKFSGLEPSALDAAGIENTIKSLEEMFSDMRGRESDVKTLALVGKELQDHCNGDEAKNVQKKIDDVQVKFAELRDKLSDTLEQMEEALPLAKRFSEAHAKFIDWIIKMEPKVRNKDPSVPEPEEQVQKLLEELKEIEPVIEILNNDGSQLAELAPGDAGFKVEDTVNKDMKRFEAVSDFIQKKADKFKASKQKSAEVIGEIDSLLDWFEKVEGTLMSAEPISSDPNKLQEQLHQQKNINEEINNQKTKARDLIAAGKRLMRENSVEEDTEMQDKMEALKQRGEAVSKIGSDKLSQLEQALPLARTFLDTHHDLLAWFAEVEPLLAELEVMTINQETVKKQQDRVKVLKQDVQDHKPVVDKLNRTVAALSKLYLGEEDLANIQGITQGDNKRVEDITAAINERFLSIDEALQQATEFTDKLDNILEMLTTTDEQMSNAEPISAHPDKIREQIMENNTLIDETQMCLNALESVQNTAEELIKQAHDSQDEAVKEVKQKLMDLVKLYEKIINSSQDRNHALEDTLYVAEKFWDDYSTLNRTLANLQKSIAEQEPPALEPAIIRDQQETLESLRDDIEASQFDFEEVHQTGEQLMTLCGAPDKPEVQKNIDDLDKDLANLTKEFDKRSKSLEEALEKAMHFQEELMKMLVWLQKREDRLREFKPVASEFDAIKGQLNEIKLFKADIDPKQVDVEALNHKASDLVKGASPDQAEVVMEPMATVNKKWEALQDNIGERQRMLQLAVLNVGQFEHAINELLSWMDTTEQTLDEAKQVAGDTKLIEIELSKHKMLQNDINAHESSVVSVREAGQRIIATEAASKSNVTKRKLEDMKSMWNKLHDKSKTRQKKLEEALKEAKEFSDDLQRTLIRLGEIEGMLIMSKPVGGLPETAKEQLEKFVEVYNEIGNIEGDVARIQSNGQKLVKKSPDIAAANIKQNLQFLQQRWDHIKGRAEDRKSKLEEAVQQANSFHSDLNRFINWLTDTEKILNNQRPVSRVIEQVTEQIEDHKALQKDIGRHREVLISLDKTGTHLKYFSQKQDVVLIKNLLSSVQHRWEKIVSRSAERTRHLEKGYREAKQFNDAYRDLMDWLIESDLFLDRENTISHDPVKLKDQIDKHKEFQKMLGAKQPLYDGVNRVGRSLKEKCPEEDIPVVQGTLNDLKKKWNSVCGKSVDRQRKLDEALIFTGQYNVALQTLLDWLAKVEPGLREEQPVHGDIDTVNNMVEEHKSFQQELGARANNVAFVRKRAKELMEKAEEDTTQQQAQLIELSTLWDRVCKLSVNKQERLEQAQKLAEDFDKKGKALLNWLATAERQLRYRGPIPDDEAGIIKQIEEHKQFEEELLRQEANLRETLNIGQDIMKRCHPDSVSTLKRWLTALRKRWEEITNWCQGRGKKLRDALDNVHNNNSLLEELIGWLNSAETRIFNANGIPIPNDEEAIVELLREHQDFMNEMSGKQPEVDRLTKSDKIRTLSTTEPISHIPVLKGLSGRRTPTLFNKYGSPRRSRDDDGRRTPEPRFRSPRIGALFNKWRQVWLTAMERQRKLRDALDYLQELEKMKGFKFDDWRKRYLQWMHHNKSRIMDFFRRQDHDRDGKVTRKEFIEGIMASRFPTSMLEMEAVANVFDRDRDGYIDYKEFVQALRPDNDAKPVTESEKIQDEVKRQVSKCTCVKQFKIHKIGEGKYRFGDSQKLRLVRILRSTVMVRVGGGWMALDEFLVKNDPCRDLPLIVVHDVEVDTARGRTNVELREQFVLAEGVSQSMAGFVTRSPSNSNSGSSTYSGASSPWSGQWSTPTRGPITKIREKTLYPTPWRENMKTTPDGEVTQIMSKTEANGSRSVQKKKVFRESQSSPVPRHMHSPGTPASRSSSRASTSSRPFSPTDSETSEASEPEVYTTVQSETRQVGGRKQTTMTYQTHVVQTRTVSTPTSVSSAKGSKIPKLTPKKK
ncbi:hypothetical protein CHS0354_032763 [Potamilus streckersoni]|uniref:Microtubule-actin cross-linking factor 1 n=1 Tax=Potamilus streckersoni TaxID=2493646 RepID=A0AAE0RYW2_9BIVA|nr:hypothetical protein CHS0354_032763 [Potamilus streckersoni]